VSLPIACTYAPGKIIYVIVFDTARKAYRPSDGAWVELTTDVNPYDPYGSACADAADFAIYLYDDCDFGLYHETTGLSKSGTFWVKAYVQVGDFPSASDQGIGGRECEYNHMSGLEATLTAVKTDVKKYGEAIYQKTGDGFTERDRRSVRQLVQRKRNNRPKG
jgi:hypothetical protein